MAAFKKKVAVGADKEEAAEMMKKGKKKWRGTADGKMKC